MANKTITEKEREERMIIGRNLSYRIKKSFISRSKIAKILGVSPDHFGEMLRGERPIKTHLPNVLVILDAVEEAERNIKQILYK